MTRRAVLGALVLGCLYSASGAALAAECGPTVILEGEAGLVQTVGRTLRHRGIAVEGPGSGEEDECPAVRAEVTRRGARLDVIVLAQEVRRSERLVEDTATAATLIESWARSDISAPLLVGHWVPRPPDAATPEEVVSPALPRRHLLALHVYARAEVAVGNTGALWPGGSFGGCVRVGPTCIGLRLRIGGDARAVTNGDLAALRLATDMLATLDVPVRLGRWTLWPGVGLGVGWLRTALANDDGDAGTVGDGGIRTDLHLDASYALLHGLALDVSLSLGGAFLGSGDVSLDLPD